MTTSEVNEENTATPTVTQRIRLTEIPGVSVTFDISLELPPDLKVKEAPGESVNIYSPAAPGKTALEQSQIFIRSFRASTFLTLTTVNVFSRNEKTIAGRPAITYDIEKKSGVANFSGQPSWRNQRHDVTDIRREDANPSVFYVFARNPALDVNTFEHILSSIRIEGGEEANLKTDEERTTRAEALQALRDRITKKPFGILINQKTSPVQPERFSGYHTGIDVEFPEETGDIGGHAVTDGTISAYGTVDGYGGAITIRHTIQGRSLLALYGHLNPASLPKQGATVLKGTQIGTLGRGFTEETDGERRHLHFGLYAGNETTVQGYVQTKTALSTWIDPLPIFESTYVEKAEILLPLQKAQL